MKTLFLENHILDDSADAPTVTRLICQQAMQCPPIMYGPHVHYLWPQCSKDDYRSCIFSLHAVIDVALAEVDAQLSGPVLDMCVWDITALHQARKNLGQWRNFESLTNLRLERLLRMSCADWQAASREWWAAANRFVG